MNTPYEAEATIIIVVCFVTHLCRNVPNFVHFRASDLTSPHAGTLRMKTVDNTPLFSLAERDCQRQSRSSIEILPDLKMPSTKAIYRNCFF